MARDVLTKEQIVHAAVELLDAEGLDGLNMRRLGLRLGAAATAMYWHVRNKDELVRLAADSVWHEIVLPNVDELDWRPAAATAAGELHAMMLRHPWLIQALAGYLLYGPGKARYDDRLLAICEKAGFAGPMADAACAAMFTYVLGNVVGASAEVSLRRRLSKDGGDPEQLLAAVMQQAAEIADGFPHLRTRLDHAAAESYTAAPPDSFGLGLTALLDGLERQLVDPQAS